MSEALRKRFFGLILFLIFAMLLILNLLTPLHVDDYYHMYRFAGKERITSLSILLASGIQHYRAMNGRIVTDVLFAQGVFMGGQLLFQLLNTLVYLAFVLGLYFLLRRERRYDWVLLCGIHAAIFLFAPVFGVTMLWISGASNYLWGTTLIVYTLFPFGRTVLSESWRMPGWKRQLFFGLASFMAGNVAENTSLSMIALMMLCLAWLRIQKKHTPAYLWMNLVLAVFGYAVLMLSPRVSSAVENVSALGTYLANFAVCMERLLNARWVFGAYILLFFLAVKSPGLHNRLILSLGLVATGLLANLMMIVPSYYPLRADFGWTIFLLAACGLLVPSLEKLWEGALWQGVVACLMAGMVVTFLWALPNNYDRYQQARARVAYVETQRDAGVKKVSIYKIKSKSKYDVYCDEATLSMDSSYLSNRCFAKFYGVKSITLSHEQY